MRADGRERLRKVKWDGGKMREGGGKGRRVEGVEVNMRGHRCITRWRDVWGGGEGGGEGGEGEGGGGEGGGE